MIRNYIKIAWRNIINHKVYSFINIAGLAVGLACSITIGLYIWDEYSYDRFHAHFKEIYRVVETQDHAGVLHPVAVTPGRLAYALKTDYAEINETCRVGPPSPGILTVGQINIEPKAVIVADNSLFNMFDFKLLMGNSKKVLMEPNEVVITTNVAERIFGPTWRHNNKLLGHQVILNNTSVLVVAGVAEDCPANSHIQFDVVLSMRYEEANRPNNFSNWENNNYHTYISLFDGTDASVLEEKIQGYMKPFNLWAKPTLLLQPFNEIYLRSHFDYGNWAKASSIGYLRIFFSVGLVVLLIALFNFINLSTARATQRAREVGVRKVIGALRKQLVLQFLSESLLMTILAVVLALILLIFFVPLLNDISGKSLSIPIAEPYFALAILSLVLFIGFLAGIYPAFYLSNFQPAKVLKGFFKTGSGQLFRRVLVVTQFTFSVMLILGAIVIYRQLTFLQDKSLGFDKEQLIFLRMKNQLFAKAASLKSDLLAQTSIKGVTATSNNLIDMTGSTHSIKWEGQQSDDIFPISHMNVDPDFLATTGMILIAGRNFSLIASDSTSWLINETAAARMGWTPHAAIGKPLQLWDTKGTIVGVVKDFHFRPMTTAIEPMLFRYWPGELYSGFFVKARPGHLREAVGIIEQLYKKHEAQTAPQYEFVDQTIDRQYRKEQNTGLIVLYFSILAILVSCLGLFGLATFAAEQRTKEIGIRKVLGATVMNVVSLLSKDFISLVVIAILIASPLALWAMTKWLEGFAYRIEVQWWMIAISGAIALSIAVLTVSFQSIKTGMMNPVNSLRSE